MIITIRNYKVLLIDYIYIERINKNQYFFSFEVFGFVNLIPHLTTLRSVGDTKYFSIRSLRKSPARESKTTTKSNKFQGSAK